MDILHRLPVLRLVGLLPVLAAPAAAQLLGGGPPTVATVELVREQAAPQRPPLQDEVPVERRQQPRKTPSSNIRISPQPEQDGSTSLIAFIETPYTNLNFRKDTDGFVARMEADVALDDVTTPGSVLRGRWTEEIRVSTYEETQGRGKTRQVLSIRRIVNVPPGKTALSFNIKDLDSGQVFGRKALELNVPQYPAQALGIAKPVPVLQFDPATQAATPNLTRTYVLQRGDQKDISYYLRLNNPTAADTAELRTRITNPRDNGKPLWSENRTVELKPGINEFVNTYAKALTGEAMGSSGDYNLEVMVVPSAAGQPVTGGLVSEKLVVHYLGLPPDFKPEEVIDQLRYLEDFPNNFLEDKELAKKTQKEIQRVRKIGIVKCGFLGLSRCLTKDPKLLDERKVAISELVNSLPSDLRTIYFNRVALANHYFGARATVPGWKTERGMVLIVLGAPDDRTSNNAQMIGDFGWEIWTYLRHPMTDNPWQVGFYDRFGQGDYRLMDGISQPGLCQNFGDICNSIQTWYKGTY